MFLWCDFLHVVKNISNKFKNQNKMWTYDLIYYRLHQLN
jgi:hypothetical protein